MAPVTAEGTEDPAAAASQFCASLESVESGVLSRIRVAQQDVQADWSAQTERFDLMSTQRLSDTARLHNRIDQERQKNIAAMRTLYAEQEQAVTKYDHAAKRAVTSYRGSLQKAQQNFEASAQDALVKRQAARAGHVEAFRIAVSDALQAAKVACSEDPDSPEVRANLSSQLTTARAIFSQSLTSDTIHKQLDALVVKRDASWNKAEQAVAAGMASAGNSLRTVLDLQ
jgi:hypothetical protein